jgi:hypothetical protein
MDSSTFRYRVPERPTSSIYWRRRFIALVTGLSVVAIVAWAFAGTLGGSSPAAGSTSTGRAAGGGAPQGAGAPTALTGSASTSAAAGTRLPASTPSPSPSGPGGMLTPQPHQFRPPALRGLPLCARGSVVLSLFSSQARYSTRHAPEFDIDVVSTASRPCRFDIGSRYVLLKIYAGRSRIWSSADCAEGQASLVTELRRGVPTVLVVTWDGRQSAPGCPVPGTAAASGNYTAVASDGALHSNSLPFRYG